MLIDAIVLDPCEAEPLASVDRYDKMKRVIEQARDPLGVVLQAEVQDLEDPVIIIGVAVVLDMGFRSRRVRKEVVRFV
ncbi:MULTISPECIES: hypothetical protein [unclassified Minwuia]|nr:MULTISPECIES: hypothetical protein [unclassified Minwuia]